MHSYATGGMRPGQRAQVGSHSNPNENSRVDGRVRAAVGGNINPPPSSGGMRPTQRVQVGSHDASKESGSLENKTASLATGHFGSSAYPAGGMHTGSRGPGPQTGSTNPQRQRRQVGGNSVE